MRTFTGFLTSAMAATAGAALVVLGTTAPAHAAETLDAVTDVTYRPSTVEIGGRIDMDMEFCIPNGSAAGDTFYLDLDPRLVEVPDSVDAKAPNGDLVARMTAAPPPGSGSTPPWRITFTMTDYVETHTDVCGDATLNFQLTSDLTQGTDITLVTSDGDEEWSQTVTTGSVGAPGPDKSSKKARWLTDDQGHTTTDNVIEWAFRSPVGPTGGWKSWRITDGSAPDGIDFDCASILTRVGRINSAGGFAPESTYAGTATIDCNTTSLVADFGAIPEGKVLQLTMAGDMVAATGPDTQKQYVNHATFVARGVDGTVTRNRDVAKAFQLGGSAKAVGVVAPPTTTTTTTTPPPSVTTPPPSTTTTSTSTTATAPVRPVASTTSTTPVAVSTTSPRAELAYTGLDGSGRLTLVAVALLVLGLGMRLVLLGWRDQRSH